MFKTYRYQRILARIDRELDFLEEWGASIRVSEKELHVRRLHKMFDKAFNLRDKVRG